MPASAQFAGCNKQALRPSRRCEIGLSKLIAPGRFDLALIAFWQNAEVLALPSPEMSRHPRDCRHGRPSLLTRS